MPPIGLAEKPTVCGQVSQRDFAIAGGDYDLDGGPPVTDSRREFEPIHAAWHVDVREDDLDVGVRREDDYGLVGIRCLEDFEPDILKLIGNVHSEKNFIFYDKDRDLTWHGVPLAKAALSLCLNGEARERVHRNLDVMAR